MKRRRVKKAFAKFSEGRPLTRRERAAMAGEVDQIVRSAVRVLGQLPEAMANAVAQFRETTAAAATQVKQLSEEWRNP